MKPRPLRPLSLRTPVLSIAEDADGTIGVATVRISGSTADVMVAAMALCAFCEDDEAAMDAVTAAFASEDRTSLFQHVSLTVRLGTGLKTVAAPVAP